MTTILGPRSSTSASPVLPRSPDLSPAVPVPLPVPASAIPVPDAVLWDMDGTLVDTEPTWAQALADCVHEIGGTWNDALAREAHGASTSTTLELVRVALSGAPVPTGFFARVETRVLSLLDSPVSIRPGALELLEDLRRRRVPQALVTASNRRVVDRILPVLGARYFRVLVTDDLPIPSKPDPAPYVLAARLLEVRTRNCLVFEDSVPGLAAARACGSRVWDVTRTPLAQCLFTQRPRS